MSRVVPNLAHVSTFILDLCQHTLKIPHQFNPFTCLRESWEIIAVK